MRSRLARLQRLFREEIWAQESLAEGGKRGHFRRVLRVASITFRCLTQTNIPARAAALSFGSLIALGPLLAISVSVSGFILGGQDDLAVRTLNRLLVFIAPHVEQYERIGAAGASAPEGAPSSAEAGEGAEAQVRLNPQLVQMLDNIIESSRSGGVTAVGFLVLIYIAINLFISAENTFNEIWGVQRGRALSQRIVLYWSVLSLGTLLTFAALTLLSVSAVASLFGTGDLQAQAHRLLLWSMPALSFLLLVVVLAAFYKFIPNAPVRWKPALCGGAVAALLILANHYLAFLYVNRVVMERSLYGSLGIVFVLMLGMFVFWFFVLVGGSISFAVQNADYFCRDPVWERLSHRQRETYTLAVFLQVCRRFKACQPPETVLQLGRGLQLPSAIVHQCLLRLHELGYVSFLETDDHAEPHDFRAQPARPLDQVSLGSFKQAFETLGSNRDIATLPQLDPLLRRYHDNLALALRGELARETLDNLIGDPALTALPAPQASPAKGGAS